MSLSWPRLLPTGRLPFNPLAVAHYNSVFNSLLEVRYTQTTSKIPNTKKQNKNNQKQRILLPSISVRHRRGMAAVLLLSGGLFD